MKTLTLTATLILLLHSLACDGIRRLQGAAPAPKLEVFTPGENGISPEGGAALKNLLFADETIETFLRHTKPDSRDVNEEPWRSFDLYIRHSKEGNAEEAKRNLRRVLTLPNVKETRMRLLVWAALRALGEQPPRDAADEVQGVVCELRTDAGVDMVAAYADGSARLLGVQGAFSIWDAPGTNKEMDDLVAALLKTLEPLVKRAPAVDRRALKDVETEHFRVSVLTLGGVHVVDIYGPDVDGKANYLAPTFTASVRLINALTDRGQ